MLQSTSRKKKPKSSYIGIYKTNSRLSHPSVMHTHTRNMLLDSQIYANGVVECPGQHLARFITFLEDDTSGDKDHRKEFQLWSSSTDSLSDGDKTTGPKISLSSIDGVRSRSIEHTNNLIPSVSRISERAISGNLHNSARHDWATDISIPGILIVVRFIGILRQAVCWWLRDFLR